MKLTEGGRALEGVGNISKKDIEATLRYISPIVGISFESTLDKKGNITKFGLEDSTLGSAGKTNANEFGKKETIGDIDVAVDEKLYDFDQLVSRLTQKLGPENMGRPMKGLGTIPTKIPVGGDPTKGYVQVDFMLGKTDLLKFTYSAPDPESLSEYKGVYRNVLMVAILQNMRRQVRDSETQEIIAMVGPSLLMNKGVINQWKHFPLRKDNNGRLTTMKAISRDEFDSQYPEHKGKEKEMTLNGPQDIVNFLFPNANVKIEDLDSFEKLRDLIIKYKPDESESIFNRFAGSLQRQGMEVPLGLIIETVAKLEAAKVLVEIREISLNKVMESIAKRGQFEDFRLRCKELIQGAKQLDHFTRPNATADMMPQEGITYLLGKCSLMDDWNGISGKDYGTDYHYRVNDLTSFYEDICDLISEENFFYVTEHYGIKMTPESFVASLFDADDGVK